MFRVRKPRPTAEPRSKPQSRNPLTRRSGAEVPGKPYAGLVSYFRNNFSEKIPLPLTTNTFGHPLCIGRKKWAGRRSGTVKFMSNGGWTAGFRRAGAEPGLECLGTAYTARFNIYRPEAKRFDHYA